MGETIVVVGAGVAGLTTALLLAKDKANDVTVVAKHMPGDYDIEYASPFAGAAVMPMGTTKEESHWEAASWAELKRICEEVPEAGLHFQKCQFLRRTKDQGPSTTPKGPFDPNPWFATLFDDFRELPSSDVPRGYDSGCEFTSVCINTAIYLPWLVGQLVKNGAQVRRAIVRDIREAKHLSHTGKTASLIVNASGLGALKMGGVRDVNMYPARGQVVVVRNEIDSMVLTSGTDDGPSDAVYAMKRAAGGGTILGGSFEVDNWESQPDPSTALRIMSRIVEANPAISDGKGVAGLSVVRHGVGLRPYRKGGARVEEEKLDDETWVVHNYGHGGWGYQGSYGCAQSVVDLVAKVQKRRSNQAKL